jgi:hypothetical protein
MTATIIYTTRLTVPSVALMTAVDPRREVYELLDEAEDPAAASRDLQTLLGTDEMGAQLSSTSSCEG